MNKLLDYFGMLQEETMPLFDPIAFFKEHIVVKVEIEISFNVHVCMFHLCISKVI